MVFFAEKTNLLITYNLKNCAVFRKYLINSLDELKSREGYYIQYQPRFDKTVELEYREQHQEQRKEYAKKHILRTMENKTIIHVMMNIDIK